MASASWCHSAFNLWPFGYHKSQLHHFILLDICKSNLIIVIVWILELRPQMCVLVPVTFTCGHCVNTLKYHVHLSGAPWGYNDLTFNLWPPKSSELILKSKWTFWWVLCGEGGVGAAQEKRLRCKARPSGGRNTQSHMSFCSDPESYWD